MRQPLVDPAGAAPGITTPWMARGEGDRSVRDTPRLPREHDPREIPISIAGPPLVVGVARLRCEFEQAFELLALNYRERGYEEPGSKSFRFTPFHALPDTATFVAKREGRVVATMTLVPDTRLLGLPMESIYAAEVEALRREGRHLGEVTSLADRDLAPREFLAVFMALIRLTLQYHLRGGGNTWTLAVNPRHSGFYRKVLGVVPLGTRRAYPSVSGHPAEAYWVDSETLKLNAPTKHREFLAEALPASTLAPAVRAPGHSRDFAARSNFGGQASAEELLRTIEHFGSPPRWAEAQEAEE